MGKPRKMVYVVMVREGQYEATEWPVIAYESKGEARAEVKRRDALCQEWQSKLNALGQPHDDADDAWWEKRDRLMKRAAKALGGSEYTRPDDREHFFHTVKIKQKDPANG